MITGFKEARICAVPSKPFVLLNVNFSRSYNDDDVITDDKQSAIMNGNPEYQFNSGILFIDVKRKFSFGNEKKTKTPPVSRTVKQTLTSKKKSSFIFIFSCIFPPYMLVQYYTVI